MIHHARTAILKALCVQLALSIIYCTVAKLVHLQIYAKMASSSIVQITFARLANFPALHARPPKKYAPVA